LTGLEIVGRGLGVNPYLEAGTERPRVRTETDVFEISDVINAIVYVRAKTREARERFYPVTHRWTLPNAAEPLLVHGTLQFPESYEQVFSRACAPAFLVDPLGSGSPVRLEILIDDRVVADFRFRVSGGDARNLTSSTPPECVDSALPRESHRVAWAADFGI
jgi:hypothetical protein